MRGVDEVIFQTLVMSPNMRSSAWLASRLSSAIIRPPPLPAALDCRGARRLLCGPRPRQPGARLWFYFEEEPGRRWAAKLLSKERCSFGVARSSFWAVERAPESVKVYEWNRNYGLMIEPTMSDTRAQYEPVAWWFTRRRLGRELRNCYQVPEELPARLLTLISELDGKPEVSLADDVPALHL
jgi:hypothetical protein